MDKIVFYDSLMNMNRLLIEQAKEIYDPTLPAISNISNLLAILYHELRNVNWAGLYYYDNKSNQCLLGPFQGKVACTRIPLGKGVVGTCALKRETIVVNNVHEFPGHIACDSASKSEIVVPLIKDDHLYAILDIDSDIYNRFDNDDVDTISHIAELLIEPVSSKDIL